MKKSLLCFDLIIAGTAFTLFVDALGDGRLGSAVVFGLCFVFDCVCSAFEWRRLRRKAEELEQDLAAAVRQIEELKREVGGR